MNEKPSFASSRTTKNAAGPLQQRIGRFYFWYYLCPHMEGIHVSEKTKAIITGTTLVGGTLAGAVLNHYAPGHDIEAALLAKGIPAVGGFLAAVVTADAQKVSEAVRREQVADLVNDDAKRRLEQNFKALSDKGTTPSTSDISGVYADFSKCWMNADPDKRRILRNAFINAFDPELYESGILTVLFEKLDSLCYGDLVLLSVCVDEDRVLGPAQGFMDLNSEISEPNMRILQDAYASAPLRMKGGLSPYLGIGASPLERFHHDRLVREHLMVEDTSNIRILTDPAKYPLEVAKRRIASNLGVMLAQLVAEGDLVEDLEKTEAKE